MSLNTKPSAVTARVRLVSKKHNISRAYNEEEKRVLEHEAASSVDLELYADYANGANEEWSAATPSIRITMTVKPELDTFFKSGQSFELVFKPIDE